MIYGIGVDIVEISRMEKVIERWGERFLRRVFTEGEIAFCQKKGRPAARFALRFAAKEAFAKALGSGFRDGLGFRQIEVKRDSNGRPILGLHGRGKKMCEGRGIAKSHLSLSDDGRYAIAMVVLEQ
jgi:holo-[acyl-carrier protein] synthase